MSVVRNYNIARKDMIEALKSITFTDDVRIIAYPFTTPGFSKAIRIVFMGGIYEDERRLSSKSSTYDIVLNKNEIIKTPLSVPARKEDIDKIIEKLGVFPESIKKINKVSSTEEIYGPGGVGVGWRKNGGGRKTHRATKKIRRNRRRYSRRN
jgi:hypothetical protein